ncbi:hypothetical protein Vadar_018881 [Vaccinium darrowii]|uniref:Uncharacterized protein n=1 Tax=Vaccinium darrowii TaxID=229202 RepID=A0ACB7YMQ3_9ERIC|nr:hypothetical protein Vadar_018881 [Vaccinium darrowii]
MDLQEEFKQIMKGKRTKRPRQSSPLALTMVSTSSSSMAEGRGTDGAISDNSGGGGGFDRPATASTTNSGEVYTDRSSVEDEEDMANCLILLAQGHHHGQTQKTRDQRPLVPTTYYQCKTCDRCFPSFQALGGHRASHNKPNKANGDQEKIKPSTTTTLTQEDQDQENSTTSTTLSLQIVSNSRVSPPSSTSNAKSRVHECSTCGAEFSSGQALGGHMRRHRSVPMATSSTGGDLDTREVKKSRNVLALDLNQLPAPEDEHRDSKFVFASKKQVIVFSASSLVDCQY